MKTLALNFSPEKFIGLKSLTLLLLSTIVLSGCVSAFDPVTYNQTKELKTAVKNLVDKSDTSYDQNLDEINALKGMLAKGLAHEESKRNNEVTKKMWQLLGSDNHLLGSYLKLWEEKGSLNSALKNEAYMQIEEALDLMILFETKKDRKGKKLLEFMEKL